MLIIDILPYELWLARDKDGTLRLYYGAKPEKMTDYWDNWTDNWFVIDGSKFPCVRWEDEEPTRVTINVL